LLSREPLSLRAALAQLNVTADDDFIAGALAMLNDWIAADVLRSADPAS
tara:strand:+ start:316 stop:462 length:147 start_codon:yes stop_codon:yes gene_type:complete